MTLNRTWQRMRNALSPSPRHPRRALMEQMEQRVLLSAGIDVPVVAPLPEALATTANVYPPDPAGTSVASSAIRHEIVFVDTRTPDYQRLVDDLVGQQDDPARRFELVLIDGAQDGVARISEVLSARHDVDAIHLIAHGSDGSLQLGATTIDARYLQQHGERISAWSTALGDDADILIYGCDVAATGHGRAFVDALASLTGADVAASSDTTGSSALGGDWTLEQATGHIDSSVAISARAQVQWQGLLTLLAYDDFFHSGNLNNDNGGGGWAGSWTNANSDLKVNGGGLAEAGGSMAPAGDAVMLDLASASVGATSASRELSATPGADGTTTWISFLLKPDTTNVADFMGLQIGGSTTQFAGYLGNDFILGSVANVVPGINATSGQTYLMVLRIDHQAGNDAVTLYVNPSPGRDSPDTSRSVSTSVDLGNVTHIGILGGQTLSTNNAQIDQLRVGTTYRDVANDLVVTTNADNNDSAIVDGNATQDIRWLIANPGGDGLISLREAMIAANNTSGADTITFNIPGGGAQTITLNAALPTIRDTVTIDGASQRGYIENGSMPVVVIDGADRAIDGLRIEHTADGSTVNGLLLRNFRGNEIVVTIGADNNTISNNFIGSLGTDGNQATEGSTNAGYGMWVNGAGNLIANNVFAGNYRAIMIDGTTAGGNRIQGNSIGTNAAGTTSIGHSAGGIVVQNGAGGVLIGTDLDGSNDASEGNLITGNTGAGISISNDPGNTVRILGNRIYGNGGLGIDLRADGAPNANDAGDADTGPNGMLNQPVLYSALVSGGNVTITGEARPGATVEFFVADAAVGAYGEGQTLIGRDTVAASGTAGDEDGTAVYFSFTFAAGSMAPGDRVTATATLSGATSEFGRNIVATSANAAPTLSVIGNRTIDEDGSTGAIAFTVDDTETAAAALIVTATSGNQTIIPNANITLGGSGANRTITVTPAANRNGGPVTITVDVSDGTRSTQRTFTVTVNPVNDPPVPGNDSYATNEGAPLSVDQGTGVLANDTDVDGDTPRVLTVTRPSHGTVSMSPDGSFTYTPNAGFTGNDTFTYLLRESGDGTTNYWGMGGNLGDSVGSSGGTTNGTTATAGVFGTGLGFNGTTSYGTLPDVSYGTEFTLAFWFRTPGNAGTGYQYLYAHDTPGTQNSLAVYFIEDSTPTMTGAQNVLRTQILDGNDSVNLTGLDLDVGALGLADNSWHLYTLTVATGVGSTVYIDGVAQASISNGGNPINPEGSVMLGALTATDTSRMFTGAMDGLQLFNGALDAAAVTALYDSPNRAGTVTIRVNDVPAVTTNTGLSLLQGQTEVLTAAMLRVTDGDNTAGELTYTIGSGVGHGRLELGTSPGVAITSFTQADIDAGIVRYVHDNSATTGDNFTFTVSDGEGGSTGTTTFSIAITSSNQAPAFTSAAVTTASEDSAYGYAITTSDADAGAVLTISAPTLPPWLALIDNGDGTATLAGTPTNANVGTHAVVLQVSDGTATTTQSFSITVGNTNDPPMVASAIPDQNATEDTAFSFQFAPGTFADVDAGDSLTYSAAGLPAWLSFDAATRTFSGTPANANVGTVTITVRATDGSGAFAEDQFDIVVANANDTPTVASAIPDQNATEDTAFSFQFAPGTFADVDAGDSLTYSAAGLPAWLSFDAATRTFSGTPANANVGTVTITVRATDGSGAFAEDQFDIVVANVNDAPTFTSAPVTAATEDSSYSYGITTSDVDAGDTRSIVATTLPAWLTLTDHGNGTATLSGTPTNAQVGSHGVVLQVSDGTVIVTQSFTIAVANVNDAPTLSGFSNQTVLEDGSTSALPFTIADVDSPIGSLTVTATSSDPARIPVAGLNIGGSGANRTLTVTPAANAAGGPVTIAVTVSDGSLSNATTFLVSITPVNDAPVVQRAGVVRVEQDASTVVDAGVLRVTDIDSAATSLRFTITATPVEGSLLRNGVPLRLGDSFTQADINAGTITYAHRGGDTRGIDVVELSVSDGAGGTLPLVSLLVDISSPPMQPPAMPPAGGASNAVNGAKNTSSSTTDETGDAADTATDAAAAPDAGTDGGTTLQATSSTRSTAAAGGDARRPEVEPQGRRIGVEADRVVRHGGGGGVARLPAQGALIQQEIAQAVTPLLSGIGPDSGTNAFRAALSALPFRNSLDEVREQFKDRQGEERNVVASTVAMSTGVSIGYVIWLLRGGVLLGSVLSSLPAWRLLDPTPVLSGALARAPVDDEEDDSLEEMLRRAAERTEPAATETDTATPEQQSGVIAVENAGSQETR